MKLVLKLVVFLTTLLLAIVIIVGMVYPKEYYMERYTTIQAPKEIVWKNISTFNNYQKWNPWYRLDPKLNYQIEGVDGMVGSSYHWQGKYRAGSGTLTYTLLKPMDRVTLNIALQRPIDSETHMTLSLVNKGDGIQVHWILQGKLRFPYNALIRLFYRPKKLVKQDMQIGLQQLKVLCEHEAILNQRKNKFR